MLVSDDMSDSPRVVDLKATIRDFEAIMEDGSVTTFSYYIIFKNITKWGKKEFR